MEASLAHTTKSSYTQHSCTRQHNIKLPIPLTLASNTQRYYTATHPIYIHALQEPIHALQDLTYIHTYIRRPIPETPTYINTAACIHTPTLHPTPTHYYVHAYTTPATC